MDSITAAVLAMAVVAVGVPLLVGVVGTSAIWLVLLALRRWGPRSMRSSASPLSAVPIGCSLMILALPFGCVWACQPVPQPAKIRTVRAVEVPIQSPADRAALVDLFRRQAEAEGMTFVDASSSWQTAPPEVRGTIYLALDRPSGSKREWEITATDTFQRGDPWVVFYRGVDPARATATRGRLVAALKARFPASLEVPVAPTGALPLRQDLERAGAAYRIRPDRAAGYQASESETAR